MSEIPVDKGTADASGSRAGTVEVEREITKRAMIEAITSVVLVLLYMGFSVLRDREPGVVALDGSEDDWAS